MTKTPMGKRTLRPSASVPGLRGSAPAHIPITEPIRESAMNPRPPAPTFPMYPAVLGALDTAPMGYPPVQQDGRTTMGQPPAPHTVHYEEPMSQPGGVYAAIPSIYGAVLNGQPLTAYAAAGHCSSHTGRPLTILDAERIGIPITRRLDGAPMPFEMDTRGVFPGPPFTPPQIKQESIPLPAPSTAERCLVTGDLHREHMECSMCAVRQMQPLDFTQQFLGFLRENPTIFHAVQHFKEDLEGFGYKELGARADWTDQIKAGGKYYVTRNGSSLIAFAVGQAYKPGNGVAMIAGHIDALTAKLKPISNKPNKAGYLQLGVAPYAGSLNQTWWDRDLSIGGRVIVREEGTMKTTTKLVKFDWPIARIPTLAPHFGVGMMGSNNKETQAVPIIGLDNSDLNPRNFQAVNTQEPDIKPHLHGSVGTFASTQPPKLVKLVTEKLRLKTADLILNWELEIFDCQPAALGGLDKEFIFAGRIDDKLCSWAALEALLCATDNADEGIIKMVALFDDEEIGSQLRQGAKSNFLPLTVERAVEALSGSSFGPGIMGRTYASSFLVSADVTHAVNPNFLGSYLEGHAPRLNVGVAVCSDSNGHMTTDSVSTAILDRIAALSGCINQTFMIRNDSRSGGTIGPSLSSAMGVRSADAGLPQLSMHSIRATTGALDPGLGVKFFRAFLDLFEKVDGEWTE